MTRPSEKSSPDTKKRRNGLCSGIVESLMWEWIIIGAVYVLTLVFFRLLGGLGAAAQAFEMWGRSSATTRVNRASPSSS
jgi:hypothetical protein